MKVNFSFDVDGSEIKEGDYFDLNLSNNLNCMVLHQRKLIFKLNFML
nr:Ig-like domain-containing protein [Lactobacillus iners]